MAIDLTDLFGGLGNSFAIIFFFLPAYLIYDMCKTKDVSKIPFLMFLFTLLNCEFWTIYGLLVNSWPIWLCNSIGIVTNHFYLVSFLITLQSFDLWKRVFYIILLLACFSLIFFVFYDLIPKTNIIGGIACIMNVCMFVSPLQKIRDVIRHKDNSYIPIWVSICLTLNSACWVVFAIFKNMDYFIMIPNAIGFVFSVFQIVLWCCYKNSQSKSNAIENEITSSKDEDEKGKEVKKEIRETGNHEFEVEDLKK